ncbi:unnamed protein product [Rotaria sp. Silwood1]|nr:unnamed protein product [Rotaria sp. Silwood1]CAF1458884.1 unnamed protein product [Rotaria sp. Silwood1]CAF3626543.1 unnamed protein product [Rotaria sp. Silwood1]CAF3686907.1 unnamed protein product [Rotaria sp. Silwood1]CAF4842783.1 unnamed protein product [Rotaria sp. Silwood1]
MSLTRDKPSFLISNKGKLLLVLNNIFYKKKTKKRKQRKYWVCQTKGCSVYVHTSLKDVVLKVTRDHNHLPHSENIQLKQFRTKVKERAMKETTPIIKIYEEEVISSQMPPETLAIMPLARELRKNNT